MPTPGQTGPKSSLLAEPMAAPGAAMSGFSRPSRVGPGLENGDRRPGLTEPLKLMLTLPPQSVQKRLLVHDAVVISSTAFPGSLTSSSLFWLPRAKLAPVPAELKKRH